LQERIKPTPLSNRIPHSTPQPAVVGLNNRARHSLRVLLTLSAVTNVPGFGGLGVNTGEPAGVAVSTEAQITQFLTKIPSVKNRFCNHDDALFEQGYDSEGGELCYDPVALDEDVDNLDEEAITCTPPQPTLNALPPLPPPVAEVPESLVFD